MKISLLLSGVLAFYCLSGFAQTRASSGHGAGPIGTDPDTTRPALTSLPEVVVTALGIRSEKRSLGYAIQEVKGATIAGTGQSNVINALAGKVAGAEVTHSSGMPGSSTRITIRGSHSLVGENQPLLVIDGVPIDNSEAGNPDNALFAGGMTGRGGDIDPNIIESVTILKGAAAAALYGSAAARGAVLLTTRSGVGLAAKSGKPVVHFSSSYSFEKPILPRLQSRFAQGLDSVYIDGNHGASTPYSWGPLIDTLTVGGVPVKKRDNVKDFFQMGHTSDNNITISGSSDKANYVAAYSYWKTTGTEPGTDYSRHSFFVKCGMPLPGDLTLTTQFTYIHSDNHRLTEGEGSENPLWTVYTAPISWNPLPVIRPDGSQRLYWASRNNPYWLISNMGLDDKTDRILPVLHLIYHPFSWFTVTERLGADMYVNTTDFHENKGTISSYPDGRVWNRTNEFQEFNNDLILEARKELRNKLSVTMLVGNNLLSRYNNTDLVQGTGLSIPSFYNIGNTANISSSYAYYLQRKVGFYAQAVLEYKKTLTLNLTGRYDGSSVLSRDRQFYPYGSASAGFVFTRALGMAGSSILDFGKLRLSYSVVGNDNVQPYSLSNPYTHFGVGNISFPVNGQNGYQLTTTYGFPLKNEDLKELEVGLETKFFRDRASLDLTWFNQKSMGLLTPGTPFAPGTGFSSASLNAGELCNRGIEVSLGITPVRTRRFVWELTVHYTRIGNRIVRLAPGINGILLAGFAHPGIYAFMGQAYGSIYGTAFLRDSSTGKLLLNDQGYPQLATASSVIGNVTPDWTGGLTSTMSWRSFSFSVVLDHRHGGNILNLDNHYLSSYGISGGTEARGTMRVFDGIIQSTGKQNNTPVVLTQDYYQRIFSLADESSVEDGSYLKLRQASVGYTIASSLLKGKRANELTLTVTATNFILHKKYSGSDPEVSLAGSGNGQGISGFNAPSGHSIIAGVKASF